MITPEIQSFWHARAAAAQEHSADVSKTARALYVEFSRRGFHSPALRTACIELQESAEVARDLAITYSDAFNHLQEIYK